jgi:hypothetical protein
MSLRCGLATLAAVSILAQPGSAEAQRRDDRSVPVPVMGRIVDVRIAGGARASGELIEASDEHLVLLAAEGLRRVPLGDISRVEYQRHGFGASDALLWVGLGGLVTGAGLTAACNQVDDTDCSGVFVGALLSWTVIGGLLAAVVASGQMERLEPTGPALRPYARFPQGAPPGFTDGARGGGGSPP